MTLASAVAEIRSADPAALVDPTWLSRVVASAGLYDDGRPLYGPKWDRFKAPLHAPGLWQHPEEFAAFLIWAGGRFPVHVMDVGCFHGFGTVLMGAYFRRMNPHSCTLGADLHRWPGAGEIAYYDGCRSWTGVTAADVINNGFTYDLVFVDADHSYAAALFDWTSLKPWTKVIAFHDIRDQAVRDTPGYDGGVPRLWGEIKAAYPVDRWWEFVRSDGVPHFGIGVVVLKE